MGQKGLRGASLGGRTIVSPAARRRQAKRKRWVEKRWAQKASAVTVTKVPPAELDAWLVDRFGGG
jgi:hypothetical protein